MEIQEIKQRLSIITVLQQYGLKSDTYGSKFYTNSRIRYPYIGH